MIKRLTALLVVNLVLAVLLAAQAFAGNVTALVGASQFSKAGDGIWYQEPFPYTLKLQSTSFGVRYDSAKDGDLSYSVGYMNLGNTSSAAIAVGVDAAQPNDGGYNVATKACNGSCMPVSHWYGKGNVQGVYASAVKHWGAFSIEGGLYLYQPKWEVSIPDWRGCRDCGPSPLTVAHNPKLQVGPMVGVRYTSGAYSLNLSWWRTQVNGDEWIPVFDSSTYNLSVGYTF